MVSQPSPTNLHATAIVIEGRGLVFTGPSGSGKSSTAFACLVAARRQGLCCSLIADDQILIERRGDHIFAIRPPAIANMLELRGSGIVEMDSVECAPLHLAVRMTLPVGTGRLPEENQVLDLAAFGTLPMVHIVASMPEPLAVLAMLSPLLHEFSPFA